MGKKMKLISHRGNINGAIPEKENNPEYIFDALKSGYDVEIDLWYRNAKWYLGHDKPQYEVDSSFIFTDGLWVHCKDIKTFSKVIKEDPNNLINTFYHTDEDVALTSHRFLWTYPCNQLYNNSVCVMPELGYIGDLKECYGICSDDIHNFKTL